MVTYEKRYKYNYAYNLIVFFSLFSKLTFTLRTKLMAFGHDVNISVRCLQVLIQAVDARYIYMECLLMKILFVKP